MPQSATPQSATSGGFGRRKTPIPATTDGAAPSRVANDSAVAAPESGAPDEAAAADASGAAHPFFSDPAADRGADPGVDRGADRAADTAEDRPDGAVEDAPVGYGGPLSVTDDLADELLAWLSGELRVGRREDNHSVLCALGALAGYAAQRAIRETMVKSGRLTLDQAFVVIETRSGEWFFFGDLLNAVIGTHDGGKEGSKTSSQYTIWKILSDAAHQAGALNLPDAMEIVKHCAATVGGPEFGLPRVPDVHMPALLPREALSQFWPATLQRLGTAGPMSWPLHLALAAHKHILAVRDEIRPDIAVRIVMEAVVPMSKVDPVTVPKEQS